MQVLLPMEIDWLTLLQARTKHPSVGRKTRLGSRHLFPEHVSLRLVFYCGSACKLLEGIQSQITSSLMWQYIASGIF